MGKWTLPSHAQVRERAQQMGANLTRTTVTPNVDANGKPEHTALAPAPESYAPRYNAYRGGEMHGVPAAEPWDGGPQGFTDGTVDVHWDHSDPDEHVVPVRIVADADEERKVFLTGQTQAASNAAVMLIPQNLHRTRLVLMNMSTTGQTVYVGRDLMLNTLSGYPLAAGASLEMNIQSAVYAFTTDANPANVAYYVEYVERMAVN